MKRISGKLFWGLVFIFLGVTLVFLCLTEKFDLFVFILGIGSFILGLFCTTLVGTGRPILTPPLNVPFSLLFRRKTEDGVELLLASEKSVRFFRIDPEKIILYDKNNEATAYHDEYWPAKFCFYQPENSLKFHVIPRESSLYAVIYSKE